MLSWLSVRWRLLSLSHRFMVVSLLVLLCGMAGVGAWVGGQIAAGVVHRTGFTTALYVESFISPQIQELATGGALTPEHELALGRLLADTPLGREIVAFKVWGPGGRVLFSTEPSMSGKVFPVTPGLSGAWKGLVTARVSELEDAENFGERARFSHLLETYTPVREQDSNRVIAVAEFYQMADALDREVTDAQRRSWLVVAASALIVYLLLTGIVRQGSATILRQQEELKDKIARLTESLAQNDKLAERVRRAARRTAELNEQYLRRVSSELHDGPTQDLSLSLLRLGTLRTMASGHEGAGDASHEEGLFGKELDVIESSLGRAVQELRAISAGLRLPEIENLPLAETVQRAVRGHERRTSSRVAMELACLPTQVSLPVKITVYRLIQEALSNAYRHGGGVEQKVRLDCDGPSLALEVSDRGPGFEWKGIPVGGQHLGLTTMRERVESLGGEFWIQTAPETGTTVVARLPMRGTGERDLPLDLAA